MHLFQSEIYESDDSDMPIVSVLPDPPLLRQTLHKHKNPKKHKEIASCILDSHEDRIQSSQTLVTIDTNQRNIHQTTKTSEISVVGQGRTARAGVNYIFGAPIYGGTFNINITTVPEDQPQQRKRRRVIFDSDSSQE